MANDDLTRFGVGLLQLLDEASTNSTYKYALLVALLDAASESIDHRDGATGSTTTEWLARRVLELYWPHARPWPGNLHAAEPRVLRTLATPGRSIVDRIAEVRREFGPLPGPSALEARYTERYLDLLDWTERTLIQYPLPRLQRVGSGSLDLVYDSRAWPEDGRRLALGQYFRGRRRGSSTGPFDNRVVFQPGAEESLARLAPLLRPIVIERWTTWIDRCNRLTGQASLYDFLFGADRVSLATVRRPLLELQRATCFYCERDLGPRAVVDHFVPWSRTGCDDVFNLVVAHPVCNQSKSDHLAARAHVERWVERSERQRDDLIELATCKGWAADPTHARRGAYGAYWSARGFTKLWRTGREFEDFDASIVDVLQAS